MRSEKTWMGNIEKDFYFFAYYIQHCFICRSSDSTVPTDAGIEPRTVATGALVKSEALTTRLDLIRSRLDRIRIRLDLIRNKLDLFRNRLDLIQIPMACER
jgi:hypothetical protein